MPQAGAADLTRLGTRGQEREQELKGQAADGSAMWRQEQGVLCFLNGIREPSRTLN